MHLENILNFNFMLTLRTTELFLQTPNIISIFFFFNCYIVLLAMHHWKWIFTHLTLVVIHPNGNLVQYRVLNLL